MTSQFLLPCNCGQSVPVQLSQAGQTITCTCGRALVVPTMRGIQQLKPAKDIPSPAHTGASWNPTRGALFGVGACLLLLGLITAAFNYPRYRQFSAFQPSDEYLQESLAFIEKSSPEELLDVWHMVTEHGLGDYESSPFSNARMAARHFRNLTVAGVVAAVCGIFVVGIPILLPARRARD